MGNTSIKRDEALAFTPFCEAGERNRRVLRPMQGALYHDSL